VAGPRPGRDSANPSHLRPSFRFALKRSRLLPWNRRYVLKSYISGSMWLVPLVALMVYAAFQRGVHAIGAWMVERGWTNDATSFQALPLGGARSLLETLITLNLSFLVFTFGSLLVAIQVAGGQYTPRIIATTLLRDNVIRTIVGVFVFTLAFCVRVLSRMKDTVDQLDLFVAGLLGTASVMVFLYLIDYAARLLRPVSIVRRVGEAGLGVIRSVYPVPTAGEHANEPARPREAAARVVLHEGVSGVVLAVDFAGLVRLARAADGVIEFVPGVGDFLGVDEPLFRLYGGAAAIDERRLRGKVALGSERTMEQDPTFALRILVDIAIKALSAAINDPTTAVMAIDQLHRLLRMVGLRSLRNDEVRDSAGQLRLVYLTPNWEDFVRLTCTEIRHCGAGSIQIVRRLRSMLENLLQSLPPHRHAELRLQLELLDRTVDRDYDFEEDRALARIPDAQGLGGALGVPPLSGP
jgi:uncharacterized membrane protein